MNNIQKQKSKFCTIAEILVNISESSFYQLSNIFVRRELAIMIVKENGIASRPDFEFVQE